MALEIERKFLTADESWRKHIQSSVRICQGYALLAGEGRRSFRIRIAGDNAFLTLKGAVHGCSRQEFEYPVPVPDAQILLRDFCSGGVIEKVRHLLPMEGFCWEIDEFLGDNAGLIVAEIELPSEDASFPRPEWLGREVTGIPEYYNSNLLRNPRKNWTVLP